VNLISWQLKNSVMGRGDRTLQFASLKLRCLFSGNISTWCGGGVLVLVKEEIRRDAKRLAEYLYEQEVDRLFLPFVALNQLAESIAEGTTLSGTCVRSLRPENNCGSPQDRQAF